MAAMDPRAFSPRCGVAVCPRCAQRDGSIAVHGRVSTAFAGGPYPFPAPAATAFLAGSAEVVLPVLLILGLGTRFAAAGLLLMVGVVQLTVPDGWPVHLTWAAMALAVMAAGPGPMSIDWALARWLPAGRRVPA